MKYFLKKLRTLFCEHEFENGIINPFIDDKGNHSAIYPCKKCGYRKFVTFNKK